MPLRRRPSRFNAVLRENGVVYAGYTKLGNHWSGGLFALHDVQPGEWMATYTGRIHTRDSAERVANQQYMLTARTAADLRRRVVIDGNPSLYDNIAGYANYAENRHANARSTHAPSHIGPNLACFSNFMCF